MTEPLMRTVDWNCNEELRFTLLRRPRLWRRRAVDGKFLKLPLLPAVDRGRRDQGISPRTDEILLRRGLGVCLVLPPHRNVVRG
jgi:hypothetical protein